MRCNSGDERVKLELAHSRGAKSKKREDRFREIVAQRRWLAGRAETRFVNQSGPEIGQDNKSPMRLPRQAANNARRVSRETRRSFSNGSHLHKSAEANANFAFDVKSLRPRLRAARIDTWR